MAAGLVLTITAAACMLALPELLVVVLLLSGTLEDDDE